MSIFFILQQVDLFRGLDEEQLKQIETIAVLEKFQSGQTVCQQGSVADRLYIVAKGQVEIGVQHPDGREPMLYLGVGQLVGEMTLVDEGLRSATVIAAESETHVVSIPNNAFTKLCQENTGIGYLIMRNIAQDLSFKLRHRNLETGPLGADRRQT